MAAPLIRHVSDTAFLVAHFRAIESAREDALFHDPLAARLAGQKGHFIAQQLPTASMTSYTVALRTVIIDEYLREAVARGVDVIVNLGAGLDTRPYRLELPASLRFIEVDYGGVIDFKEQKLGNEVPRCRLERLALDLGEREPRRELLARIDASAERVLILTEGLVPYLDLRQAGELADDLRAVQRLDSWIVDYIAPGVHRHRERRLKRVDFPAFKFQPPDWHAFFAAHGFHPLETRYLAEEGARRGRRAPLPLFTRFMLALMPRQRRAQLARFYGYALLGPIR